MRDVLVGAAAVLLGHAVVFAAVRAFESPDPILSFTAVVAVLLGLIQVVYVLPLMAYGLWRRRGLAAGAVGVAAVTAGFSLLGFLAT